MQPSGGRQGAPEADDHPYMPLAAEPWRFNATVRMGAILCGLAALCAAEAKAAGAAAAVAAAAAPPPWEHPSLLSGAVEWHRSLLDDENGSYAAAEQLAAQAPPESSAWLARWVLHGAASPSVGTCPRATWVAMPAAQRAAAVAFSVPVAHLGDGMLRRLLVAGHLATVGGRGGTETADFVTRSPIRPAEGDNGSGRTLLITVAPGDPFTPELTRAFIRAVAAGAPFAGMRERRPAASMLARMATRVGAGSSVRDWLECANAGGIGGRLIASLSSDVPEGAKQPVWATLTYDPAKPSEPAFDSCATRQMTADLGLAVSARMIDAAIKINSCGRLSAIAGYK